jgi:hypothetical protein
MVQAQVAPIVVHVVVASGGPGLIRDANSSQLLLIDPKQSRGTLKRRVPDCEALDTNVMSGLNVSVPLATSCDSSIVAAGQALPPVRLVALSQEDDTVQVPVSDPPQGRTLPQLAAAPPLSPPHPATSAAAQIKPTAVPIVVALLVSIVLLPDTGAPS